MAVKRLALISGNARKAEEWKLLWRPQGVTVAQILPDSQTPEQLLIQGFDLVCREQSLLVSPGGEELAPLKHLALVDHLSQVETWHATLGHQQFSARRAGYLDATQLPEAGGWWDSQFCDADTGLSYQQQAILRGTKLSARSAVIEQLIDAFLPPERRASYLTDGGQVVDFDRSVAEVVAANPCFQGLNGNWLENLVTSALSQGLVLSLGQTRAQQVYFWPGLSGIPSVPRSSCVDEAKFLFHDLVHFQIGRLVPHGPMSEHERQVFLAWAMVEEAVALLLADGFFVDHLRASGLDYDFDQHKGYPFFCSQGWQGQAVNAEALWANVRFFVLGDRSGCPNAEDPRAIRYFEGFERFSLGDWLWNERMSLHARHDADFYQRWWKLADPVNRQHGLGLVSLAEAAKAIAPGPPHQLVRNVFDHIWNNRLQPVGGRISQLDQTKVMEKARWRWLVGQLGFFAAFPESSALQKAAALVVGATEFGVLPPFLRQCLQGAVKSSLCSAHQAQRWGEFFPLFPPYYVSYKQRPGLTVAALSQRILGPDGGAKLLENDLDIVVAIVTNRSRQRFLLERKVNHPIAAYEGRMCLIGGFRQHPGESMVNTWRREVCEEWTDPASLEIAVQLANRTLPWRRFQVQGAERPGDFGLEVLLVELPDQQFDDYCQILVANNCAKSRPEGWPEVRTREEIPNLPLFSGHDTALAAYLDS